MKKIISKSSGASFESDSRKKQHVFEPILDESNHPVRGLWKRGDKFYARLNLRDSAGCMAFTGIFEIIEFAAAKFFADASDAYLGSQGDVWDAQWDMLLCAVGTIVSILLFRRLHIRLLETAEGK